MKKIHELELHEELIIAGYTITRVPGGWIYQSLGAQEYSNVFVPFTTEFRKPIKLEY